jgi:hypothetical protein
MPMNPAVRQKIQIVLAVAIGLAAIRSGYVLYQRYATNKKVTQQKAAAPTLNPDYYVTPKKL